MYGGHRLSSGDIVLKLKGSKDGAQRVIKALKANSLECKVKREGKFFWIGFLGSNSTLFWKLVEPYILDELKDLLRPCAQSLGSDNVETDKTDLNNDSASMTVRRKIHKLTKDLGFLSIANRSMYQFNQHKMLEIMGGRDTMVCLGLYCMVLKVCLGLELDSLLLYVVMDVMGAPHFKDIYALEMLTFRLGTIYRACSPIQTRGNPTLQAHIDSTPTIKTILVSEDLVVGAL
ncbi:Homing endonuclease, LAGLIDADG [Dillenia turbinata]|uniref:Homing endonuclease, LAGLIDADG n=1 Tax=Dillenia turbinata TaxID=194707 RepID=A0AAN8YXG4_9MAGN